MIDLDDIGIARAAIERMQRTASRKQLEMLAQAMDRLYQCQLLNGQEDFKGPTWQPYRKPVTES
jgi:hypothetical protein